VHIGAFKPTGGEISVFEPPTGKGVRVDACAYSGYQTSTKYDALLAKVITHSQSTKYADCVKKMVKSLQEFRLEGFPTNVEFLLSLLANPKVIANDITTSFVDEILADSTLTSAKSNDVTNKRFFETVSAGSNVLAGEGVEVGASLESELQDIGNALTILSPMQGTIISIDVAAGSIVSAGQQLAVMEAMKMEHVITARSNGVIRQITSKVGEAVSEGKILFVVDSSNENDGVNAVAAEVIDPDYIRPDLEEVLSRQRLCEDFSRPESVAKRHKLNRRTARENLYDLVDEGSFVEYGGLTIAAQRRRRSVEDLIQNTPADGMVCGIGSVNADLFARHDQEMSGNTPRYGLGNTRTSCVVLSYDYMVLAGTQGLQNHRKKDRMFELAESLKLPVILFAEGGVI
jgi:biotin carboxyl carrier protein